MEFKELAKKAIEARDLAYSPYSDYCVGAALLCEDGEIVMGGNIETATYDPTTCAERVALFSAIARGKRKFKAIAVSGGKKGEAPITHQLPCGTCRQVFLEWCDMDFKIVAVKSEDDVKVFTVADLLPYSQNF